MSETLETFLGYNSRDLARQRSSGSAVDVLEAAGPDKPAFDDRASPPGINDNPGITVTRA